MDVSHALSRKAKRAEEDCMRDAQLTRPILHLGAAALLVLQHPLFFPLYPVLSVLLLLAFFFSSLRILMVIERSAFPQLLSN